MSTAWSQNPVTVVLTAPNAPVNMGAVTAFGYYMSPYSGTVAGTVQRLNCVDFFHDVSIGDSWQANNVNLGVASTDLDLLKTTRDGSQPNLGLLGGSLSNTLDLYEQMAYLTAAQPADPGGSGAVNYEKTIAIQTAIWAIGDPGYEAAAPGDVRCQPSMHRQRQIP